MPAARSASQPAADVRSARLIVAQLSYQNNAIPTIKMVEGTAKRLEFLLYGHLIIPHPIITIDLVEKIFFR